MDDRLILRVGTKILIPFILLFALSFTRWSTGSEMQ